MSQLRVRTRRWTRHEYDRLIEIGFLHEDDPIELIAGRLIVAEPQQVGASAAKQEGAGLGLVGGSSAGGPTITLGGKPPDPTPWPGRQSRGRCGRARPRLRGRSPRSDNRWCAGS